MKERYGEAIPLAEPVISPAAHVRLANSARNRRRRDEISVCSFFLLMIFTAAQASDARQAREIRSAGGFCRPQVGRPAQAASIACPNSRWVWAPRGCARSRNRTASPACPTRASGNSNRAPWIPGISRRRCCGMRSEFQGGGTYVLSEYAIDVGFSLRRRNQRRGAASGDLPVLRQLDRHPEQGRAAEFRRAQQILRHEVHVQEREPAKSCANYPRNTRPPMTRCSTSC